MSSEKSNEPSTPRPTFSGGTKPSMSMSTNNIQRRDFVFDNSNGISKTTSIKSNTSSKSTDSKKK